jgi:hypothetical protein
MANRSREFPEPPMGGALLADFDRGTLVDPQRTVVVKDAQPVPASAEVLWEEVVNFRGLSNKASDELGDADPLAMYLVGVYGGLMDATGTRGMLTEAGRSVLLDDAKLRLQYTNEGHPLPDSNGIPHVSYYSGRMEAALFARGENEGAIPTTEVPPVSKYLG